MLTECIASVEMSGKDLDVPHLSSLPDPCCSFPQERLTARGIDCSSFIEKHELITRLKEDGGSSATTCSICCDDFASGDPVRVLACHHRYRECMYLMLFVLTRERMRPLVACQLHTGTTRHTPLAL
jgi:hypothetical protein